MPGKAWTATAIVAAALLLTGCMKAPGGKPGSDNPFIPTRAQLDKVRAEGPLQTARAASKLEFWLHYKIMQANGMEQALGGESQAVAALKAVSAGFERSAGSSQTRVPRLVPAAFDGNGLDAGVMGIGYGLVGGAVTGGMLAGGLSNDQIADAARKGPITFGDEDGSGQVDIAQNGMDTTLEQTVSADGVTGKVKTKIHMDACPDAEGKLVVTIESESQMSAGGKSGTVKVKFRYERWLDDDAHLIDTADGFAEELQIAMSGTGAKSDLSFSEDYGFSRDGKETGDINSQKGFSIFRPDEARHTEQLRDGTRQLMGAMAELMLDGTLSKAIGGDAPWESGRCVDLQVRSDPAKRSAAKPNTAYTVFAEPRAKSDGRPAGGTVKATLSGERQLNPTDKVKADAKFDYANPEKKDLSARIDFVARSKRGVGKANLDFDTRKPGYHVASVGGECTIQGDAPDLEKPFSLSGCGISNYFTFTPSSAAGGTFRYNGSIMGAKISGGGSYKAEVDENGGTIQSTGQQGCAGAGGRTVCNSRALTFKLTPLK